MKRSFRIETSTSDSTVVLRTASFQIFIQEKEGESTYLHIDGHRNTKDVLILEINQRGFSEDPDTVVTQHLTIEKGKNHD